MLKTQARRPSRNLRNNFPDIAEHDRYIYDELQKSKATLNNSDIKMTDAQKVFARIEQRLGAKGL